MTDFIIVPDTQIFETCCLARENNSLDHPCLKLFLTAWHHYIDSRGKVIYITENLNDYLIDKKYKSKKEKRQALFSVVRVVDGFSDCGGDISQMKLASKLSIEEDKDIYYVTDNKQISDILKKESSYKVTDSAGALKLFEKSK